MNRVIRNCARFAFRRLLPKTAYPVLQGPLRGAKFILGSMAGEGGGSSVYFNMMEAEQTAAFKRLLRPGDVVLDIGANVGYYTILGSRLVGPQGRVVAVEPVIRNLCYLYRHVALNKSQNVQIIPAACSDTLALACFSPGTNYATGALAGAEPAKAGNTSQIVPTITVDAISQRLGITPTAIKLDVEGAELSVLRGAQSTLRGAKPAIFLSTHSAELRESCLMFLAELGYACETLSLDKKDPSEFLMQCGNARADRSEK